MIDKPQGEGSGRFVPTIPEDPTRRVAESTLDISAQERQAIMASMPAEMKSGEAPADARKAYLNEAKKTQDVVIQDSFWKAVQTEYLMGLTPGTPPYVEARRKFIDFWKQNSPEGKALSSMQSAGTERSVVNADVEGTPEYRKKVSEKVAEIRRQLDQEVEARKQTPPMQS